MANYMFMGAKKRVQRLQFIFNTFPPDASKFMHTINKLYN